MSLMEDTGHVLVVSTLHVDSGVVSTLYCGVCGPGSNNCVVFLVSPVPLPSRSVMGTGELSGKTLKILLGGGGGRQTHSRQSRSSSISLSRIMLQKPR